MKINLEKGLRAPGARSVLGTGTGSFLCDLLDLKEFISRTLYGSCLWDSRDCDISKYLPGGHIESI